MYDEDRKLSRELGWIIGLGLLGVVAAYLIDPGPCDGPAGAGPQDPWGFWTAARTESEREKSTNPDKVQ